jgi:hypothetical protein
MWRARLKTVGAILSGLYTAGSLILAARGLLPNWPQQLHYLIGFIVFGGIMWWIIADKDSELNSLMAGRPQLTLGKKTGVKREFDAKRSEIKVAFNLSFTNVGKKAAYRFRCRTGLAPETDVSRFKFLEEKTSVNPVDPDNAFEIAILFSGVAKYSENDGVKKVPTGGTLIHCMVSYSDSPDNGKLYRDEWWFSYRADMEHLGVMSEEQKNLVEPYVRKAYRE